MEKFEFEPHLRNWLARADYLARLGSPVKARSLNLALISWLVATHFVLSLNGMLSTAQEMSSQSDRGTAMQKPADEFNTFGLRIAAIASTKRVRDKPFRADFEEIHTRKSSNETIRDWGFMARDSDGRTREDHFGMDPNEPSKTNHVTTIWDAVTLTQYFIDHNARQVQKLELGKMIQAQQEGRSRSEETAPESPGPLPPRSTTAAYEGSSSPLGERTIEGVQCYGTLHTNTPAGETTEHWSSIGISHCILEITKAKDIEIIYRLYNVQLTEPDPSLFVMPNPNW